MKNFNEYKKDLWKLEFSNSPTCQNLYKDSSNVLFEKNTARFLMEIATPRQSMETSNTSATIFYYLDKLLEVEPYNIYDIGCGCNTFKKHYPHIIGIGAEDPNSDKFYADIHDYFDSEFVKGHENYFESAFSINALHFVSITEFKQRYIDFFKIVKPGGRGFLSTNSQRFIDRTSSDTLKSIFNAQTPSGTQLENYIREEIQSFFAETSAIPIIVDILDLSNDANKDEFIDGNIRILFEKPKNS